MRDRAELEQYVATSRAVQRACVRGFGLGVALAFALLVGGAGSTAFVVVFALTGIVAGAGYWITNGHIQDFEQQLRKSGTPRVRG